MRDDYLFAKKDLRSVLENVKGQVKETVQGYDRNYLLNISESDVIDHLISEFTIEPPELKRDSIYVKDQSEADIDVSQDPMRAVFDRSRPVFIKGVSVTIAIPFDGEGKLFEFAPSTFTTVFPRGRVEGQELLITYRMADREPTALRQRYEGDLRNIESYLGWVRSQVNEYNAALPEFVKNVISARKQRLLADANLVSALGIPIKRREGEPGTYAPPEVRRKPKIARPQPSTAHFTPEPALPGEEYEHILKVIERMVLVMERSPRAFGKMDEESLRDHILVQINGHYEGQATGETFNAEGKTDILIRSEGKNVFIAECKFWKGSKALLESIDQLLSYSSWRDTKTAILIFNRNRDHTAILQKIAESVPKHPNFKKELSKKGESHFRYLFHQPGDKNREVIVSILAFDVPAI